jgi:two-component system sensor histidine kinase BaeS
MQPCLLDDLIRHAGHRFESELKNAEIALDLDLDQIAGHQVFADPHRLRQVVDNLLRNTVRYTDRGGRMQISGQLLEEQIQIDFHDSAPCVEESDLYHLFERFYRVDKSRNRSTGGTGLGLAICKMIVNDHQGDITAFKSNLGGLHIRMVLPKLQSSHSLQE